MILPGGDYEYVRLSKEMNKTNSRLAYSNRTREYLRRRVWRTLRRLGEMDDDVYVDLACGVLLMMNDDHAEEPRQAEVYHYDWNQSYADSDYRQLVDVHHYDAYAGFVVFNHILHSHSQHYKPTISGRAWRQLKRESTNTSEQREEAFPELWDRHPDMLLKLLTTSHCAPVHQFAATALREHPDYYQQLNISTLALLLRQPYPMTAELALTIARDRYDPEEPDTALLEALLDAELAPARQQALQWLEASQNILQHDVAFIARLLLNRFKEIRAWIRQSVATRRIQ